MKGMKSNPTFEVLSTLGSRTTFVGDTLSVTENGWVKVWLRKKLVGVIKDWARVTLSPPEKKLSAAGKDDE